MQINQKGIKRKTIFDKQNKNKMKTYKLTYLQGLATYLTKRGIKFKRDLDARTIEFDFKDDDQSYFLLITEFGRFYEKMDLYTTI